MDKILIGTRLEEDELNKHQNFYNQKAVNEKGHKRFHGAFTGGFSAGYKGTVGSEEGFVPKSFTSSRQKRADQNQQAQSIQDYMDEEDLGGHVIGGNLTTREEFDSFSDNNNNILQKQLGKSILGSAPSELMVEQRKTIGWQILNNLQYKKKKREELKKQINILESIADEEQDIDLAALEKEYQSTNKAAKFDQMDGYRIKTDFMGIGCLKGQVDETGTMEEEFNRLIKRSYMTQEEIEQESEKKKEQNRIYTDFNKEYNYDDGDDEDDPIEPKKAIEYEQTEVLAIESTKDRLKSIKGSKIHTSGLNKIVVKDPLPFILEITPSEVKIPEDYNPYQRMQEYIRGGGKMIEFQKQKKKFQRLNAVQRKAILEDQLEMDKIREKIETKKFVKGSEDVEEEKVEGQNEIYKQWDSSKQQRYHSWVEEKEGNGIFIAVQMAQLMSYKEMKNEQKEFEKVYKIIQKSKSKGGLIQPEEIAGKDEVKKSKIMVKIEELQQKLDSIKNFRKTEPWLPDKLLCRRFGVVPPYQDKAYFDKKMAEFKRIRDKEEQLQTKAFKPADGSSNSEMDDPASFGLPLEFKSNKYGLIQYKKDENDMDYDEQANKNDGQDEEIYDVKASFEETRMLREEQIKHEQMLIDQGEGEKEKETKIKEKPPIQLFKSIFGEDEDEDDEMDEN